MKKSIFLAGLCLSAGFVATGPLVGELAAQAQRVTAGNVTQVDFPVEQHVESLAQTSNGTWLQFGKDGEVRFTFNEVRRDATSVYLNDPGRNFAIRVDLSDMTLSFQQPNGEKAVFGRITAASANPPIAMQSQTRTLTAPAPAPPPAPTPTSNGSGSNPQWGTNEQQGNGWDSQSQGNGWGSQQPRQPSQPQQPQSPESPPWATSTGNQSQQPSSPPWKGNSGSNTGTSNGGGFGQSQPADSWSKYEGVWVEADRRAELRNDADGPINWKTPRLITMRKVKNGQVILRYHDNPTWFTPLTKRSDTQYSDGRTTVNFSKSGDSYYADISGPQGTGGTFEQAKTADDQVSRDRFNTNNTESRRTPYNGEGFTKDWNYTFHSYDGLNMDLFVPERGKKVQIFKTPGDFDYAQDDNINQSLVWGLRGLRLRTSSARQTETMITNASTFQDEMSYNFGGGISTPKGSLGANYSREQTSGGSLRSGTTRALGIARVERFGLMLDKPNAQLSDGFRRRMQMLIDGRDTPENFIGTFGTHYANAIIYGGLGRATKDMRSTEVGNFLSEKYSASVNGGVKGASLNGGFSEARSSSTNQQSVFTAEQFEAIGGSGSMSLSGWNVQDSDTVPVRYDLRPLSELLSPIYFPSNGDQNTVIKQNQARAKLSRAIEARMRSAPRLPDRYVGPRIYRVTFNKLTCLDNGDEGDATVDVYGKIAFGYHDDTGTKSINLFSATESSPKSIYCQRGNSSGVSLDRTALIVLSATAPSGSDSGFGRFYITDSQLFEDDNSFTDLDDRINADNRSTRLLSTAVAQAGRTGQVRDRFGSASADAPTLQVEYTITELK